MISRPTSLYMEEKVRECPPVEHPRGLRLIQFWEDSNYCNPQLLKFLRIEYLRTDPRNLTSRNSMRRQMSWILSVQHHPIPVHTWRSSRSLRGSNKEGWTWRIRNVNCFKWNSTHADRDRVIWSYSSISSCKREPYKIRIPEGLSQLAKLGKYVVDPKKLPS